MRAFSAAVARLRAMQAWRGRPCPVQVLRCAIQRAVSAEKCALRASGAIVLVARCDYRPRMTPAYATRDRHVRQLSVVRMLAPRTTRSFCVAPDDSMRLRDTLVPLSLCGTLGASASSPTRAARFTRSFTYAEADDARRHVTVMSLKLADSAAGRVSRRSFSAHGY